MLRPTFNRRLELLYQRAKRRNFTPPNLLDFLSKEELTYDWSWRLWWKPITFMYFLHGLATFIHVPVQANSTKVAERIAQLESKSTSAAFDAFWIDTMPNWLWLIRVSLAFLGFIGVAWYAVWLSGKADSRGYYPWRDLVFPIVLVGIISSGDYMTTIGKSVRDVMNTTGEEVLVLVGSQSKVEQAQALKSYPVIMSAQMKQCEGQPPGELQSSCFQAAGEVLGQVISADRERFGNQEWLDNQEEVAGKITAGKQQKVLGIDVPNVDVGAALMSGIEEGLMIILDALGEGFQFIIESAYLLTALLLPIALLSGLSPLQAMGPLSWISSMVGIGAIKFLYNVVVAIGADLLITTGGALYVVFGIVSAVLAPLLAVGLAGGGGVIAILAILQFSSQAANSKQGA